MEEPGRISEKRMFDGYRPAIILDGLHTEISRFYPMVVSPEGKVVITGLWREDYSTAMRDANALLLTHFGPPDYQTIESALIGLVAAIKSAGNLMAITGSDAAREAYVLVDRLAGASCKTS